MSLRFTTVLLVVWCTGALLAGCNAGGLQNAGLPSLALSRVLLGAAGKNVVQNGAFNTGKLEPWSSCGKTIASISREHPEDGRYDALTGSTTAKQEVKGWSAICQRVQVPSGATLSAWLYQQTNEPNAKHAYQEVALADAASKPIVELAKMNDNHNGWVHKSWNLAKYAGRTETLFFGVFGSGRPKYYDTQFIDGVSLVGASATPSPPPGPPIAKPSALTFTSASVQAFSVEESGYTGAFAASTSNAGVATVSPSSASGPDATFKVTPVAGGSCTITVLGSKQQAAKVAVTVDNGIIIIDRATIKHTNGGF